MKALPHLLISLLVASAALLNSNAAFSGDARANEALAQPPAGGTHKKADKSFRKARVAHKKAKKYHGQAHPLVQAPVGVKPPVVAENPYLPSSAAPIVAKANVYLPAATTVAITTTPIAAVVPAAATATSPAAVSTVVATTSAPIPDAPKVASATATPAAPLILAKSLTLTTITTSAPVVAQAASVATPQTAPVVAPRAIPPSNPWNTAPASSARVPSQKADTIVARSSNPYLAYNAAYNQPYTAFNPIESIGQILSGIMFALPSPPSVSQPYQTTASYQTPATSNAAAPTSLGQIFNSLRDYLPEPHLPSPDIDILPSITKVYPTGEKPLYVLTFKCPTELIGITPLPTKALRWLITAGMDGINSTNLLSFNMQQVCQ